MNEHFESGIPTHTEARATENAEETSSKGEHGMIDRAREMARVAVSKAREAAHEARLRYQKVKEIIRSGDHPDQGPR